MTNSECTAQCGCFTPNTLNHLKSLENHGSHLMVYFDDTINVDECVALCEEKASQCCENMSCLVEETEKGKALKLASSQNDILQMSQLFASKCCSSNENENCCDDQDRQCC